VTASAPSLLAAQRWLAAAVRRGRPAALPGWLAGTGSAFAPRARVHVYTFAYAARLVEVLAGDYPAVRAHLGARRFERLARAYVRARPSTAPVLASFGTGFPAFLRRADAGAFVADLARLELALTHAFDAAEFVPLAAASLASATPAQWPRLRLALNPSVQLLRLPAAVVDGFAAWQRGERVRVRGASRGTVDVLVVRVGDRLVRHQLPRPAANVLRRLQRGASLGRAIAGVAPTAPLGAWFAQWRADGLFVATA
jgi:hypothetical protein